MAHEVYTTAARTASRIDHRCERCETLERELAETLDQLADSRVRCAALLESLAAWNEAGARVLGPRGGGAR